MKTQGQLQDILADIDARMTVAANTAENHAGHWLSWKEACGIIPAIEDVPCELRQWWRDQVLDAGKRAFGHEALWRRSRGKEYDDGLSGRHNESSIPYVVSTHRGFAISVDLAWSRLTAAWSTKLTIAMGSPGHIVARWELDGIPVTAAGADGACNVLVEIAKKRIDRVLSLTFGQDGA